SESVLPSSLAHLVLHSFPTRRSSDLSRRKKSSKFMPTRGRSSHFRCADSGSWHREHPARANSKQACSNSSKRTCKRSPIAANRRDRKSTRLNSSHVSISYAVFCLKKK